MIRKIFQVLTLSLGLGALAHAATEPKIVEQTVEYQAEGVTLEGVRVYNESQSEKRPGILVIHQWKGVSPHEVESARKLAKLGYNVFVADIYGKGIRPQPPESAKEAGKYKGDRALFRQRLDAAFNMLSQDQRTDATKLGAIGYCFGGTGALELARAGQDVKGVVSFHGGLGTPTPTDAKNIRGKILVLHGADDPFVPADEVKAFHQEMADAKVDYKFVGYEGAVHSFTHKDAGNDNSKGSAYNEKADQQSWAEMVAFFKKVFGS